jgi:hypothetical protein
MGKRCRPWPAALQPQDDPAGVADHPGGDMQQPVAQRLGFGGERAVHQQRLGPAGQVLGGQDQLQPDGVAAPAVERQVEDRWPWRRGCGPPPGHAANGATPGAAMSGSGCSVRNTWKRWPPWSVKRSWAPGGRLLFGRSPRARRPAVQVHPASQLDHLGARPDLAVRSTTGVQPAGCWLRRCRCIPAPAAHLES